MQARNTNMENLPGDAGAVAKKIIHFIGDSLEQVPLMFVSNRIRSIFKQDIEEAVFDDFLTAIVQGNQDKARYLLKYTPGLFLKRGKVTDFSHRTFVNVTAFQLALWAKDYHMWSMMISCIPDTEEGKRIRENLLEQYRDLERHGISYTMTTPISYTMDEQTYTLGDEKNSKHYDMQPLFDAMQFLSDYFRDMQVELREIHWINVIGSIQRTLPAHVMNEFCKFSEVNEEGEEIIIFRTFKFLSVTTGECLTPDFPEIYPLDRSWKGRDRFLGTDFALFRGNFPMAKAMDRQADCARIYHPLYDLNSLRALDNKRTEALKEIPNILSQGLAAATLR